MKKLILILVVITASVLFLTSCKENDYKVIVDYNLSFDQMLKAGNYDSIDNSIIKIFPIPNQKKGIKVFSITRTFTEINQKSIESLQPREIDSLLRIMNDSDNVRIHRYVQKNGYITEKQWNSGKIDQWAFKPRACTVQYKKPDKDTLVMRLFKTKESVKEAGYRQATVYELMAFGTKYPEVQREYNVFADSAKEINFVTVYEYWRLGDMGYDRTCMAVLTGNNSVRKIQMPEISRDGIQQVTIGPEFLAYYKDIWNSKDHENSDRFLGVLINDGRTK